MKVITNNSKRRTKAYYRITPTTEKQLAYHQAMDNPDVKAVVALGYPGTGKTVIFAAKAAKAYEDKQISRIILLRPNVGCGREIGFLPGDEFEKTYPFHKQVLTYLSEFLDMPEEDLLGFSEPGKKPIPPVVEIQSFWTLQGRDLSDCWVFVDEAQNLTLDEMFILVTRGASKFVCVGDVTSSQVLNEDVTDDNNGLAIFYECMGDLDYVVTVNFDDPENDIMRPGIVKEAIIRLMPKIEAIRAKKREPAQRVEIVHLSSKDDR